MLFSEVIASLRRDGDAWVASVGKDWLQGRSLFGGLQVALAVQAMRSLLPAGIALRTVQAAFLAPVPAGDVRLSARILRSGKSATHVEARLLEGDQDLCTVVAVFGTPRESIVRIVPAQPRVDSGKAIEFAYIPGRTPEFLQHCSMRFLRGAPIFSGEQTSEAVIELGLKDSGPASDLHVIALADIIPPLVLSWFKTQVAGSSMTWMLDFLVTHFDRFALQGWRIDAEVTAAAEGYTSQSGILWAPGGVAVALSRQSMVVFG